MIKNVPGIIDADTQIVESMTNAQKERVNAVHHMYGDDAPVIVKLVNGRGIQSWKNFFNNALRVNKARGEEAAYYTTLTQTFNIGEIYDIDSISKSVNEERADLDLPPYVKRINAQCVDDFLTVFFVEEVYHQSDGITKAKFRGYKPLFRLKAMV